MNKNSMKRQLARAFAIAAGAALLTGCGSSAGAGGSGLLKVGVRKNLSNFSSYNEEADTYYGFEDDLARELALRLGYSGVEYVGLDPDEREEALETGSVSVLIAAFSYTDERAEKFDLSDPYYVDAGRVMVEKSSLIEDYRDLAGTKVAVRSGTTAEANLAAKLCEEGLIADKEDLADFLEIVSFDSYEDMDTALEWGDVDAVCADGCITLSWMDDERAYFDEAYSEEDYVLATKKGSELTDKLSEALAAALDDGTIESLEIKWGINDEKE